MTICHYISSLRSAKDCHFGKFIVSTLGKVYENYQSPPQSISDCEMAGLKMFLALCFVLAATQAVQLERKPFKRLIPADVLRGKLDHGVHELDHDVGALDHGDCDCRHHGVVGAES